VLRLEVSTMVKAPRQTVLDVYADYSSWPRLFPTISGVRLLRREGAKLVLELDHVEGTVINKLLVRRPDQLDLWEEKRRYDAWFHNRFETVPGGTRFTVRGDIHSRAGSGCSSRSSEATSADRSSGCSWSQCGASPRHVSGAPTRGTGPDPV
jgi:hypothetical protein